MSVIPGVGGVPHHLSVLSTGSAAIDTKHAQMPDILGAATGPPVIIENPNPVQAGDRTAVLRPFERGSVYWTESTGAHEVHGVIFDVYQGLGGQSSPLGLPVTDMRTSNDGVGTFNFFQRGAIFSHPTAGTNETHGAIHDKWVALGAEGGLLGYPTTDETATRDGIGRFNNFQHGSIFWTADIGAFEIHGPIRNRWMSLGAEKSYLGYPVADEADTDTDIGGRVSRFQNGAVFTRPDRAILELPESVAFDTGPIVTQETLGGSVQLVINSRGDFAYTGHMHNSGFLGLTFSVATALHGNGQAFVASHEGVVAGSNPLGPGDSRDEDWSKAGTDRALRDNWPTFKSSSMRTLVDIGVEAGEVIGLVLTGIFVVGVVIFAVTPGNVQSRNCPDGSTVFWHQGERPPDCSHLF